MRDLAVATLWVYFGWYASSLAAEYLPIPGFAGALVAIGIITLRRAGLGLPASTPLIRRRAEHSRV